jgi:hypothetical protein
MSKKLQLVGGFNLPVPDWNQTDETQSDYIKNKPKFLYGTALSFENVRKFYPDGKEVNTEFQSELSSYLAQSNVYCEKYDLNNDGVCNIDDLNTLLIWMQDPTVTETVDGAKPGDYYFTKDGCIYACTDIDKWVFVFSADVEVSSSVLKLTSNPTVNTVGYVGQLCVNKTSNVVFICTGLSADYEYQWMPVVDNSTVITELQNKTKLLTTDQYTNSALLFSGTNFAPNTNAGTAELGAYSLPWKKVYFPMGVNYGIDIAGNMVTTYELLCLTGARMNLQSAIDDLGTAVNNLASGKSSFREAEFANFDTYYNQTYTQRDYSLVSRCVAMGRRGHDIVSMVPYVYRPASVCNVTNASDGSKLYLSNVDSDFWLRGIYLFTASYHYLYDKTAGVY